MQQEKYFLVNFANKYFNQTEPWRVIKENKEEAEKLCYNYLSLILNLAILLNPIIPTGSNKVLEWLHIKDFSYQFTELKTIEIFEFYPLYQRIIE